LIEGETILTSPTNTVSDARGTCPLVLAHITIDSAVGYGLYPAAGQRGLDGIGQHTDLEPKHYSRWQSDYNERRGADAK